MKRPFIFFLISIFSLACQSEKQESTEAEPETPVLTEAPKSLLPQRFIGEFGTVKKRSQRELFTTTMIISEENNQIRVQILGQEENGVPICNFDKIGVYARQRIEITLDELKEEGERKPPMITVEDRGPGLVIWGGDDAAKEALSNYCVQGFSLAGMYQRRTN